MDLACNRLTLKRLPFDTWDHSNSESFHRHPSCYCIDKPNIRYPEPGFQLFCPERNHHVHSMSL